MRVLRIYHSGVVTEWRARDRELRRLGVDVRLVTSVAWNEGGATVSFRADGDEFVRCARTLGSHPFLFVYDPRPIWKALRQFRPDLIDCHEEPASLAALETLLLRWVTRSRAPILFYGAQNIAKRYPPPFRWFERFALSRAAGAHCCNDAAGRIFRSKGLSGPVRTLGLGIDPTRFHPRSPRAAADGFVVGFVGRLEWRKGLQIVIQAMAALPHHVVLRVIGAGPDEARLRELAHGLGLGDRVRFEGFRPNEALPDCYRELDALVVPSLTTDGWVEQFGRVIVEAMACAVPVIGSDSGSVPEVMGSAGIVVPEADVDAWCSALRDVEGSPELWNRLSAAGRQHAARYSWGSIARQQLELYEAVTS